MKIRKGDNVSILSGKDSGKTGKVGEILASTQQVIVEGANMRSRIVRAKKANEKNQTVQYAAPMHASNVALICPKCSKKTRVGFAVDASGKKQRRCAKCKQTI